MIDFSTLQGLTIPEGVVTQITDASGRVLWMVQSGDKVVLEVEKITSNTVAGGITYENEEFIYLLIYPKPNGTVSVSYGGLTKTSTDTSGAETPNAIYVYFGTFNGVADSVTTPASGELTIEGDFYAFGVGSFSDGSKGGIAFCNCITNVIDFANVVYLPYAALNGCAKITAVQLPDSVQRIENVVFQNCTGLKSTNIPAGVTKIGINAFSGCTALESVIFENVTGWYVTDTEGAESGTAVDLNDPTNNATLLTGTYVSRYWYRA